MIAYRSDIGTAKAPEATDNLTYVGTVSAKDLASDSNVIDINKIAWNSTEFTRKDAISAVQNAYLDGYAKSDKKYDAPTTENKTVQGFKNLTLTNAGQKDGIIIDGKHLASGSVAVYGGDAVVKLNDKVSFAADSMSTSDSIAISLKASGTLNAKDSILQNVETTVGIHFVNIMDSAGHEEAFVRLDNIRNYDSEWGGAYLNVNLIDSCEDRACGQQDTDSGLSISVPGVRIIRAQKHTL